MAAPILPETMGAYSHTSEPVRFERDCSAVMVPSGEQHTLPAGAAGYITQALGGSFTVYVDGNLFRVRNEDADAIGKEPMPVPTLSEDAADADVEKLVWSQLRTCYDPEIPVNVVDLGLVYSCELGRTDDGRRTMLTSSPEWASRDADADACGRSEVRNLPRWRAETIDGR